MLRYLVAHLILAVSFLPFITSSYAGDHPNWPTDAFGNPTPRVEPLRITEIPFLSDWATEPYSTPTPRVEPLHKQKIPFLSDWATEPYGTPTPRVDRLHKQKTPFLSDWATEPRPYLIEPLHNNEIPLHPEC